MVTIVDTTEASDATDVNGDKDVSIAGEDTLEEDSIMVEATDTPADIDEQTSSANLVANHLLLINVPETPTIAGNNLGGVPYCAEEVKPRKEMKFDSLESGLAFYREYAKICGFSTRLDATKTVNGVITHKRSVCNKEGSSKHEGTKRKRNITRVKCNAKVCFKRLSTGEYQIYDFVEGHSHPMATPTTMFHLKPCRDLNLVHKKMIMDNSRVNQGPSRSFRMFKEYVRGYKNVGASLEDFKNFGRDLKRFIKEFDAQMLIENFMQKKAMCPSFYFDFEVDAQQNLNKNFWADPIGIKNYALFGDSNSFDATYDFNKCRMVFTSFTDVDNHKKCVTFASGMIAKENEESFTWLFQNFVNAMGGCYPMTLITDECRGKKAGVKNVFDGKTQHRYCIWHIMKKLPEKVGSTICRDTEFLKEITCIVWDEDIEPTEFESRWGLILEKYELSGHEWLNEKFDMRELWIPAYFRGTFLGGIMRTTSRSESENSFFGNFTNPNLSLVEFWMRYKSAMDAQRWKHSKLTADSKNSSPIMSTPLLLEKKCAEFYTPKVFYEFQEELKAACFSCVLEKSIRENDVDHISIMDEEKNKVYQVDFSEQKFLCSCKRFERIGILCRHALWVLRNKRFDEVPREYLLDRWSKNATCRPIFNMVGTSLLADCSSIDTRQNSISELWSEVFTSVSLVEDDDENSNELLEILKSFNKKLLLSSGRGKSKNKKAEIEILLGAKIPTEAVILPPKQSKNKGSGRRILSDKEKAVQENAKPLRKCRACGEMSNHDSRNCPGRI